MSQTQQQDSTKLLTIECPRRSSGPEDLSGDMFQTGDVVEEIRIGDGPGSAIFRAPFKGGKTWVQKVLHNAYKTKETSITLRLRRSDGREIADLKATLAPSGSPVKKQYVIRSAEDPTFAVAFADRSVSELQMLQASRSLKMVNALSEAKPQDGFVSYPWERKMEESLSIHYSSSFLSILFLPKASNRSVSQYNDLEDTLARANAWLNGSQASGAPIVFMNVQTESLLTKISGDAASSKVSTSSLSDLSNVANVSLYGFEDYYGIDIGVVRALRLWYAPLGGEFPVNIQLKEGDSKLGFAISRTDEGFIYISSIVEGEQDVPSTRSGLRTIYKEAEKAARLLVISRISNEKVLPWIVSSTGAIRCFDTVSISQKLSLHRHAKVSFPIHVFMWDHLDMGSSPTLSQLDDPHLLPLPRVDHGGESGGTINDRVDTQGSSTESSFRNNDDWI